MGIYACKSLSWVNYKYGLLERLLGLFTSLITLHLSNWTSHWVVPCTNSRADQYTFSATVGHDHSVCGTIFNLNRVVQDEKTMRMLMKMGLTFWVVAEALLTQQWTFFVFAKHTPNYKKSILFIDVSGYVYPDQVYIALLIEKSLSCSSLP